MKKILQDKDGKFYGNVGEVTPFVVDRQYLQVGDVVEIFYDGKSYGNDFVVKSDNKYFVMGIRCCCNDKIGEIDENWKIKIYKKYYEVKDDEEYGGIKMINEEAVKDTKQKLYYYSSKELIEELNKRSGINVIHTRTNDESYGIYTIIVPC